MRFETLPRQFGRIRIEQIHLWSDKYSINDINKEKIPDSKHCCDWIRACFEDGKMFLSNGNPSLSLSGREFWALNHEQISNRGRNYKRYLRKQTAVEIILCRIWSHLEVNQNGFILRSTDEILGEFSLCYLPQAFLCFPFQCPITFNQC